VPGGTGVWPDASGVEVAVEVGPVLFVALAELVEFAVPPGVPPGAVVCAPG
jgi:hypothetical protein